MRYLKILVVFIMLGCSGNPVKTDHEVKYRINDCEVIVHLCNPNGCNGVIGKATLPGYTLWSSNDVTWVWDGKEAHRMPKDGTGKFDVYVFGIERDGSVCPEREEIFGHEMSHVLNKIAPSEFGDPAVFGRCLRLY